jgi:hypothetical protein
MKSTGVRLPSFNTVFNDFEMCELRNKLLDARWVPPLPIEILTMIINFLERAEFETESDGKV